jgi:hypothetical protein
MKAYHFVSSTLRDGRAIPQDGVMLEETGTLEMCKKGLHASLHVQDALRYAPGNTLCLVELDGEILEQDDKVCASKRTILARFDATDLLRQDARNSALSVLHLWNAPDVVKRFLETGDESIRQEARNADAASYAAYYASYAAYAAAAADAYYAADAAAADDAAAFAAAADPGVKQKNRDRLQKAVDDKFKELGY